MLDFKLYAISDRRCCSDIPGFVSRAASAGLRAFQLREKDLSGRQLFELATNIRSNSPECKLFVNDRADVASASGAFGVHLPEASWPPDRLKSSFPKMKCGVSVHSFHAAGIAEESGADFLLFGPIFETPHKEAQGLDALEEIVKAVKIPVYAVGGVTPERATQCLDVGAWGVAAIRDLMLAPDISRRLDEYKEALGSL